MRCHVLDIRRSWSWNTADDGQPQSQRCQTGNGGRYWSINDDHQQENISQSVPDENHPPAETSTMKLHTYMGEDLQVQGEIKVTVTYRRQHELLCLIIVTGPSLLGRDWLHKIQQCLHQLQPAMPDNLQDMLD